MPEPIPRNKDADRTRLDGEDASRDDEFTRNQVKQYVGKKSREWLLNELGENAPKGGKFDANVELLRRLVVAKHLEELAKTKNQDDATASDPDSSSK
jgi:hypothetical protein